MSMPIDVRRIDDADGIENTLINHHAKYHEACRLMFNNTKRAQKRRCPSKKRSVPRPNLRGKQLALQQRKWSRS